MSDDPRMIEEAANADDEWRQKPVVLVTRRDQTPIADERCRQTGRMQWDDRITFGTSPGVVCTLRDAHEGDHFDSIDGVWWEVIA